MGLLNTIAEWFNNEPVHTRVPSQSVFESWVQRLASGFNTRASWDGDGDAEIRVIVRGVSRVILMGVRGDRMHVFVPSNIIFPPGGLPGKVAAYLSDRNRNLSCGDWDAIDTGERAYFTIRASGMIGRINYEAFKDSVIEMTAEAFALDQLLVNEGYAR